MSSPLNPFPIAGSGPQKDLQRLPLVVLEFEKRIAEALETGSTHGLASASCTVRAMNPETGEIANGCDVALQWICALTGVLGNSWMERVVKRGWARSERKRVAEWVARFVAACEDEVGVPRSSRCLSREFVSTY